MNAPRIVVIGAGISGLAAARKLIAQGYQVSILEARSRAGGRIFTDTSLGVPIDLGAAWIHGSRGNPIYEICSKNNIATEPTDYSQSTLLDDSGKPADKLSKLLFAARANRILPRLIRLAHSLDHDISVAEAVAVIIEDAKMIEQEICFLNRHLIEFEAMNASSIKEQSLFALLDEYGGFQGGDRLFPSGYSQVIDLLKDGVEIQFEQIVRQINHTSLHIQIETNNKTYDADAVIVTLPLGVLKSGNVIFSPKLPSYMQRSIDIIPVGSFNKIAMRFAEPFWHDTDLIELIPKRRDFICQFINWHRYTNHPVLIALLAADTSRSWEIQSSEKQMSTIMTVLRQYFGSSVPDPIATCRSSWDQDPFTAGAYSSVPPGATARDFEALGLRLGRLFFAGEATSLNAQGTAHGAYRSGIRAAKQLTESYPLA